MARRILCVFATAIFLASALSACTTLCARGLCAGNYDWNTGVGALVINKRFVTKSSTATTTGARWTSSFGSITFNQYGRDIPTSGMNEAGLMIQLMELGSTQYPVDERPSVGVLEWIQYQLDQSASIDDVIRNSEAVRIRNGGIGIHYLVGDRHGNAATIEYLDGALVVHRGDMLPVPVLANDRYEDSLTYLRRHSGFGGTRSIPSGSGSLDRFVRAAALLAAAQPSSDRVESLFGVLDSVRQQHTQWSIVYDPATLTVRFRTATDRAPRAVQLSAFDLDCRSAVKMMDLDASQFTDYTTAANFEVMDRSYAATSFLAHYSDEQILHWAAHPESSVCKPPAKRRSTRSAH